MEFPFDRSDFVPEDSRKLGLKVEKGKHANLHPHLSDWNELYDNLPIYTIIGYRSIDSLIGFISTIKRGRIMIAELPTVLGELRGSLELGDPRIFICYR